MGATAWSAAIVCLGCTVAHFLVARSNPNTSLDANRDLAQAKVEEGDIWVPKGSKAEGDGEPPYTGLTTGSLVMLMLMAVGVLLVPAAELARMMGGWPGNKDLYPPIAGPGDQPYVYFNQSVTSVKGYWRANGIQVNATCPDDPALRPQVSAHSKTDSWGGSISVGSKEPTTSTKTLWTYIQLPKDPALAGKTLNLSIAMNVSFPQLQGSNRFDDASQTFMHTCTIKLASTGAGGVYQGLWRLGIYGGTTLHVILGFVLFFVALSMRNQAEPTEIFVPKGPKGEDDEDEKEEEDEE
jgi:hypothetical protein